MKALVFNILLEEPLLATQVNSEEPNSNISYSFIPGSTIRGALVSQYLGRYGKTALIDDETGFQLFLSGKVRFLNGYLFTQKRLLPKPLSWFVEKGEEGTVPADIYDFAVINSNKLERPKSPGGAYVYFSLSGNWLVAPKRRIQVHNASTTPGKKAAGLSQVYRYDALAAGQTFQAIVLADDDVDIKPLKKLMDQHQFVMGGATMGGYGLVKINKVQESANWFEYSAEAHADGDEHDYITCLSEVILRDEDGQASTDLGNALGIGACIESFQATGVVGGFNQKWGLPLPQSVAIQAGSVFKFPKIPDLAQKLKPFLESGVGERTVEGYGRVALNLHTKAVRRRVPPPKDSAFIPDVLSVQSAVLAQTMADRYLRTLLEGKLQEAVRDHASFKSLPSSTQLSRVRVAARHALAQQDLNLIISHMNSLKGAKADWEKAKLGGERMFEWIKEQAQLNGADFLQLFKIGAQLPQIAGQTSKIEPIMEIEFRARFIDGVLKQAVNHSQAASNSKRGAS